MIEFGLHRSQARFDVAQAFPISELGESQAQKLIFTGEFTGSVIAAVSTHAFVEFVLRQEVQQLREDGSSREHLPALSTQEWIEHGQILSTI
jgi:hypothetical protein